MTRRARERLSLVWTTISPSVYCYSYGCAYRLLLVYASGSQHAASVGFDSGLSQPVVGSAAMVLTSPLMPKNWNQSSTFR